MFVDLQESLRLSIESCIREHLEQEDDRDAAIIESSREIVRMLFAPVVPESKPCSINRNFPENP